MPHAETSGLTRLALCASFRKRATPHEVALANAARSRRTLTATPMPATGGQHGSPMLPPLFAIIVALRANLRAVFGRATGVQDRLRVKPIA